MEILEDSKTICYHCGDSCRNVSVDYDDKTFCCEGCKLVYDVLRDNELCSYYKYNEAPGNSPADASDGRFGYLDDDSIKSRLLKFDEGDLATVIFHIPKMHCSSCIWLLEHLQRINPAVLRSRVSFLDRKLTLVFRQDQLSLRGLVELLAMIGYEPQISMEDVDGRADIFTDKTTAYRIGIAGFAFGNIMLFSFPEYFSIGISSEAGYARFFGYLNLVISLPVFFYCSAKFFKSAWNSIHQRFLNIDVPIALGILVMFVRSCIDILTGSGPGYFDTMAGLVFFMLVGRYFQDKTYSRISFDRDYRSFFPVSVMIFKDGRYVSVPLSQLKKEDVIFVRNDEIVPADSVLISDSASIDYSFVTGESIPVLKRAGEQVFAGGKQKGPAVRMKVVKDVSQSYLTQLWNDDRYLERKEETGLQLLVDHISHYFTFVILAVALISLSWWLYSGQPVRAWDAFTTVLIIACPCALAISSPFTLGSILRIFGSRNLFLRGYPVIERLANVDFIVFDKTGTLTETAEGTVEFIGPGLTSLQMDLICSSAVQSTHPLSRSLRKHLKSMGASSGIEVISIQEAVGKGLKVVFSDHVVRLGALDFVSKGNNFRQLNESAVHCSIDGSYIGEFLVFNMYRPGVESLFDNLRKNGYPVVILTGDNAAEKDRIRELSDGRVEFRSNQLPDDKLKFIQHQQMAGKRVLMVGDGLNDAGALRQAHVGLSVSDDINNFSPACDGILSGDMLSSLPVFLRVAKASKRIIIGAFSIALVYNVAGCWFAVRGELSPVIAAILMPLSTVTIIGFTTGLSSLLSRRSV